MASKSLASAQTSGLRLRGVGAHTTAWISVKSAAYQEEANFPWRQSMEGALSDLWSLK
jgi:hypothetical protein